MSKPNDPERDTSIVDVGQAQVSAAEAGHPPKAESESVPAAAVVTSAHTVATPNASTEQPAQTQPQHVSDPGFQVARESVTVTEQVADHEAEAAAAAAALEVTTGLTTPEMAAHSQAMDTVAAAAMVAVSTPTGTVPAATYTAVHPSAAQIPTSHLAPQMIAPSNASVTPVGHASMRVPVHASSLPPVSPIRKVKPTPPFVCEVVGCGKTFGKKFNLKAHRRVHTGEEPFACSYPTCGKTFKWKSSLTFHEGLHLNVVDDPPLPPVVDPNVNNTTTTATAVTVTVSPEQDKTAKTEAGKVQ